MGVGVFDQDVLLGVAYNNRLRDIVIGMRDDLTDVIDYQNMFVSKNLELYLPFNVIPSRNHIGAIAFELARFFEDYSGIPQLSRSTSELNRTSTFNPYNLNYRFFVLDGGKPRTFRYYLESFSKQDENLVRGAKIVPIGDFFNKEVLIRYARTLRRD